MRGSSGWCACAVIHSKMYRKFKYRKFFLEINTSIYCITLYLYMKTGNSDVFKRKSKQEYSQKTLISLEKH